MNLQPQIDKLQAELDELKRQHSEQGKTTISEFGWEPSEGETYYVSVFDEDTGLLTVEAETFSELNTETVTTVIHGMAHETRQKAQASATVERAKHQVRKRIAELNRGWVPDWNNHDQYKYYICEHNEVDPRDLQVHGAWTLKRQPDWQYLKSEEDAEDLIKECNLELLQRALFS